jgi:hypothetical protein
MINTAFKTYAQENGGRVMVLFLLFLLALYALYTSGFSAFAVICISPAFVIFLRLTFQYKMFLFWMLFSVNYLIQWKSGPELPIPVSLPNEILQLSLIMLALIDVTDRHFNRVGNIMFFSLICWAIYCTIEMLNDTCGLGFNIGAWYTGARMLSFQLIYIFLVFSIYISNPQILIKYLCVWACFALFAVIWVWKQKTFGFTSAENSWIQGPGRATHILQAGTLIRYFSIFSDAANYGIGMASTGVAFVIFGITAKIKKLKYLFLIIGGLCIWGMFPSGTRTAIACLMAGFIAYIFLSKSFKIAIPFTIVFAIFAFILVFTNIGAGNQQIRRMRSTFNKNDASANVRTMNQQVMKKYMKDAPWGIGIGMGWENVPANNKYRKMATIPPDSDYVFIWLRTGRIGITIFLILTVIMFIGACWIVFYKFESPSLRGIGAGFCCAFLSQQLGGYGNQVLMQFPNCLIVYGGLSIVYILPYLEKEWIEWESKELAIQEEKKRLKLEKKRASRV